MKNIPVGEPIIESDFVALPVDLSQFDLPPHFIRNFVKKEEFHITLIGKGHGLIKRREMFYRETRGQAESATLEACHAALKGMRFEVRLLPKLFMVEKNYSKPTLHTRRSLIVMCQVESVSLGNRDFYETLGIMYCASVEPPPFHITLYTHNDEMSRKGIGLTKSWEMGMFAKKAEGFFAHSLLRHLR